MFTCLLIKYLLDFVDFQCISITNENHIIFCNLLVDLLCNISCVLLQQVKILIQIFSSYFLLSVNHIFSFHIFRLFFGC